MSRISKTRASAGLVAAIGTAALGVAAVAGPAVAGPTEPTDRSSPGRTTTSVRTGRSVHLATEGTSSGSWWVARPTST